MTPHNPDAERSVLACLLNDQDGTLVDQAVAAGLKADSFYEGGHAAIFQAIVTVRGRDAVPDTIAVCQQLMSTGDMAICGGASGVLGVANSGGSLASFKTHLEILLCLASQRAALSHLKQAESLLSVEYATRDELHSALTPRLAHIENSLHRQEKVRGIEAIVSDAAMRAAAAVGEIQDETIKIYTGIEDFDRYATPIEPHELVVIAARPSIGKSSLSRQIAWHTAKRGLKVACFLLETSDTSFVEGCAAQEARVGLKGLRSAPAERVAKYREVLSKIRHMDCLRLYDRDLTIDAIESRCRVLANHYGPNLVVIDYLQIVRGRKSGVSTADAIGDITMRCVGLVKLLRCPILLMSQLNRAGERDGNRQPMLSDLRDSGSIEADAHRIIFIHRPDKDRNGMDQIGDVYRNSYDCQLVQGKCRDGPRCMVPVKFFSEWSTFGSDK